MANQLTDSETKMLYLRAMKLVNDYDPWRTNLKSLTYDALSELLLKAKENMATRFSRGDKEREAMRNCDLGDLFEGKS